MQQLLTNFLFQGLCYHACLNNHKRNNFRSVCNMTSHDTSLYGYAGVFVINLVLNLMLNT